MNYLLNRVSNVARINKAKKAPNEALDDEIDIVGTNPPLIWDGDFRSVVKLPNGEDLDEWIAINNFFNQINMLYGTLTEFCTDRSCPVMSAGPKYEYLWADGLNVKKPVKISAPKYVDCLMSWVQKQLENESIFPSKIGAKFPKDFRSTVKNILKRLFRIYAHIYHDHFDEVRQLLEEPHLNTSFKHFIYFVQEFDLVMKRELAPLQKVIDVLCQENENAKGDGSAKSEGSNPIDIEI